MTVDSHQNQECPICYHTIKNRVVRLSCCKTRFCMKCLDGWRPSLDEYVNGDRTCPCCRALVPPTQHVLSTIGFYKEVSLSLRILMLDVPTLPITPFSNNSLQHNMDQVAIRQHYKNIETTYGQRVHLFEQNFGSDPRNTIASSPPKPVYLPTSVVEAVRAENFLQVRQFLGSLPISPQQLNATSQENGDTLLHMAVQAHQHEMVKVLLALGAQVNSTNRDNRTPLQYAVQANDEGAIAKTLIRWGAKKVSVVPSISSASAAIDSLLAAVSRALEKSGFAPKVESEDVGRHCKFQENGVTKRGTIVKVFDIHYIIVSDDAKEYKIEAKRSVEICKPLLFDFRDIDRDALFPKPPPLQIDLPKEHNNVHSAPHGELESMSNTPRNSGGQRPLVNYIHGVDPTSMTPQALHRLLQRVEETIQAMETSQRMAREVLRIHQEMALAQRGEGSEESSSSIHSHAYLRRTQESIAAQDDDIQSLRNAATMLVRRVHADGIVAQVQQLRAASTHA